MTNIAPARIPSTTRDATSSETGRPVRRRTAIRPSHLPRFCRHEFGHGRIADDDFGAQTQAHHEAAGDPAMVMLCEGSRQPGGRAEHQKIELIGEAPPRSVSPRKPVTSEPSVIPTKVAEMNWRVCGSVENRSSGRTPSTVPARSDIESRRRTSRCRSEHDAAVGRRRSGSRSRRAAAFVDMMRVSLLLLVTAPGLPWTRCQPLACFSSIVAGCRVAIPVERLVVGRDHHALGVEMIVEAFGAALAADAGIVDAAPGRRPGRAG